MRKGQLVRTALVSEGIEGLEEFRKAVFVGAVWHHSSLNELPHSYCNYLVLVSVIKMISNKPFSGMGKDRTDVCHLCLLPLSPRVQGHLGRPRVQPKILQSLWALLCALQQRLCEVAAGLVSLLSC